MFTVLLILSLSAPPTFTVEDKAACTCNGKLPCSCGESCRCVAVSADVPCWGGACPATAKPAAFPKPMAGPGPVVTYTERTRVFQRTRGFVGRFFLPWRR